VKKLRLKIIGIIAILFLATTVISIPVRADYYSERILLYYGMRGSEVVRLQNDLKSRGKIIISSMSNPYFAQRYIGAKRVIS